MEETHQEYLGDGVYVSFDGYHILLRANDHQSKHVIALEPQVLMALDKYRENLPSWQISKNA